MGRGSRSARRKTGWRAVEKLDGRINSLPDPCRHFASACAFGTVPMDRMFGIGVSEGNTADQLAVRRQTEAAADQVRIRSQGGLRDRIHAEILCREHEVGDVQSAIHRAVNAEFLFGGDQRHMRRVEKTEILQPLPLRPLPVLSADAQRLVELHPADLAPFTVDAFVAQREREIRFWRMASSGMSKQAVAKARDSPAGYQHDLPRLDV